MRLGGGNDSFRMFVEECERGDEDCASSSTRTAEADTADTADTTGASTRTAAVSHLIGSGRDSIRQVYESQAAIFYRRILKAKVEGQPVPSIQEMKSDPSLRVQNTNTKLNTNANSNTTDSSNNNSNKYDTKKNTLLSSHLLKTTMPSPSQRFLAGLQYYSYRYVISPIKTINHINPKISISAFVLYLTSKMTLSRTHPINTLFHKLILSFSGAVVLLSFYSVHWIQRHRHGAYRSCTRLFEERVNQGRIKRTPNKYDIYFPQSSSSNNNSNNNGNNNVTSIGGTVQKALLFFPESLVDVTSYCAIMSKLSDCGVLVVVVNIFEPTRVVCPYNNSIFRLDRRTGAPTSSSGSSGSLLNDCFGIIYHIEKLMGMDVKEWVVGGHGDGGDVALELRRLFERERAKAAAASKKKSKSGDVQMKCVSWGLSKSPTATLTKFDSMSPFGQTLFITASNDLIAGKFRLKENLIPVGPSPSSGAKQIISHYNIENGNHSGFAHYGPQTFPRKDGNCVVTIDVQQKECLMRTLDFIFEREPCADKKD